MKVVERIQEHRKKLREDKDVKEEVEPKLSYQEFNVVYHTSKTIEGATTSSEKSSKST